MLRFQKDLHPHLSFSYRFRPSTQQRRIRFQNAYTLSAHAQMNSTHAHFNISAREIGAKLKPHGRVCPPFWILTVEWSGARSCLLIPSPFSDGIVFSFHTRKQRFQKSIVFKSLHPGKRFRMAPFSVIVFGVVMWTIAVSGAKQPRFHLKTD